MLFIGFLFLLLTLQNNSMNLVLITFSTTQTIHEKIQHMDAYVVANQALLTKEKSFKQGMIILELGKKKLMKLSKMCIGIPPFTIYTVTIQQRE